MENDFLNSFRKTCTRAEGLPDLSVTTDKLRIELFIYQTRLVRQNLSDEIDLANLRQRQRLSKQAMQSPGTIIGTVPTSSGSRK